jgi:hypothetical protein
MTKLIVNCETGEEILRELTKAEEDQQKIDEAEIATQQTKAEAREAQRQVILDRLGLTSDEARLILGS